MILRINVAQSFFLKTPDHAVVNTSVELSGKKWKGLVNGVSREILRNKDKAKKYLNESDKVPNWLLKRWKRDWSKNKKKEGGGTSFLLSNGKIFDKVGVNKSTVSGIFPKQFRSKILGAEKKGKYWASGISVVAHMKNPKMPAIHFNTRFIVTSKEWFGGGMDVTPSHEDKRERKIVHDDLKKICLQNKKNYQKYKKWCDEYFYLPHRNEARGIGGIFFDYETKNWIKNFKFVRELGLSFIDISKKIITLVKYQDLFFILMILDIKSLFYPWLGSLPLH